MRIGSRTPVAARRDRPLAAPGLNPDEIHSQFIVQDRPNVRRGGARVFAETFRL
jgi:hypothetical protein